MSTNNKNKTKSAAKDMEADVDSVQAEYEDLSLKLSAWRSFTRNQILRIWDILNPIADPLNKGIEWPSNDFQLQDMYREYFTKMHQELRIDVNKANQIITTRNNELLDANQTIDRLTTEATRQTDDLRYRVKVLERDNQQADAQLEKAKQDLETVLFRYGVIQTRRCDENSEATQAIESLRATVRVLTKELTLEMDARATSERALAEERRRHKRSEKLSGNWKAAVDELGAFGEMTAFAVDHADMTKSADLSTSKKASHE